MAIAVVLAGQIGPTGRIHDEYHLCPNSDPANRESAAAGLVSVAFKITVNDVLSYLAAGMTQDEILADLPDLIESDLRACLAFETDRVRQTVLLPT